jgi:hypothetical protein
MPTLVGWATKPRDKPETNQPNERSHWILRFVRSPFAFPVLFVVLPNAFVLYYFDFRHPVTVTIRVVADICYHAVAIAYGILLIPINKLISLVGRQPSLIERIIETAPKATKRLHRKGNISN